MTLTGANGGAYAGRFDVVMDSGDHITGSFNASSCSGISTVFGSSSTATCI